MKLLVVTMSLMVFCGVAYSQSEMDQSGINDDVLSIEENVDDSGGSLENLSHLLSRRVDLNSAGEDDLKIFYFLTQSQIHSLLRHREENGKLISILELQSIEGFDISAIRQLRPFAYVRNPKEVIDRHLLKRVTTEGDNYIMLMSSLTMEEKAGFTSTNDDQRFIGPSPRILMRFRSSRPGDFSVGITAEKDEGEEFKWRTKDKRYGADFLSVHAQLQNKGRIKNIIVGDYQYQTGQGLVWGGALGFGKGAETIHTLGKPNVGIVPYTSAYEAGYLRGMATTLQWTKNLGSTFVVSSAYRDASLKEVEDEAIASSLQTTGLHRNIHELSKRAKLNETAMGGAIHYTRRRLDVGVALQHLRFAHSLDRKNTPYNQFSFEGRSNTNISAFASYNLSNIAFFSEVAKSLDHGDAYVMGALVSLTKKLDVAVVYRDYAKDYHSFYANAISENTTPQNEEGFYWGAKYKFNRRFTFSSYIDVFRFPWLKYRVYAPTTGMEWLWRISWQPSRHTLFYLQGRQENKGRNVDLVESKMYSVQYSKKDNYWLNIEYNVSINFKMKSRIQYSRFAYGKEISGGFLFYHDASLHLGKFKLAARYTLFDTDDYDNRLYAYENDVWLTYSLPSYFGKGTRKYVLVQYKFNKQLTFWMKYSHTRFLNSESMGSGTDLIAGNRRNDIKFELRFSF